MKLTLRELFLLVALAAMGCGWWVDRWRMGRLVDACRSDSEWMQQVLTQHGGIIAKDKYGNRTYEGNSVIDEYEKRNFDLIRENNRLRVRLGERLALPVDVSETTPPE
jgi:hypothetical protein